MKYSLFSKTTSKYFYFFFKMASSQFQKQFMKKFKTNLNQMVMGFVTFSINKLWRKIERNKKRVSSKLSDFFNNYEEKCQVNENDSMHRWINPFNLCQKKLYHMIAYVDKKYIFRLHRFFSIFKIYSNFSILAFQ